MIPKFNRSISLPMNPRPKAAQATFHVRSVSLPSQSHPLISNLEEQIQTVRSWAAAGSDSSFIWIETGLSQIEFLHLALNDFLNLSDTRNVLQREASSTESLLDNLLHLVDAYGSLLSVAMTMKQKNFEVQSAFRRCDFNLRASSLKSQRKTEKELCRVVSSLRASVKCSPLESISSATQVEIIEILKEAISATTAASVLLFTRVVNVSTMTTTMASSSASSKAILFAKKNSKEARDLRAFQKLKELEKCAEIAESGSEKVFRSLVNSRVSLLNIQSDLF